MDTGMEARSNCIARTDEKPDTGYHHLNAEVSDKKTSRPER